MIRVALSGDGTKMYAIDSDGNIYTSSSNWSKVSSVIVNTGAAGGVTGLATGSTGQYVAVSVNNGDLYVSSNSGNSFTNTTQSTSLHGTNFFSVAILEIGSTVTMVFTRNFWNSSEDPSLYYSTNNGSTWIGNSNAVGFGGPTNSGSSTFITCDAYGYLKVSSDGINWTNIPGSPVSPSCYGSLATNADASVVLEFDFNDSGLYLGILTYIYPCFKEDSLILTDKGYKPVQDLRKGDLVKTLLNGFLPIDMIGKRDIVHSASADRIKDQLYKCSQTEYPDIFEPLVLTGCHSILVDKFASEEQRAKTIEVNGDAFVTDKKYRLPACADERATVYEVPGTYTIYHLALENPDYYMNYGIYANGLLVESCSKRYLKELSNMELIH
jgi:Hint domain